MSAEEVNVFERLEGTLKTALDSFAQLQLSLQTATAAFLDFRSAMHIAKAKCDTEKALADERLRKAEDTMRRMAKKALKGSPAQTGVTEVYHSRKDD